MVASCAALAALGGCQIGQLFGSMAQTHDEQKLIDTPARYAGLENKTIAVVVEADMSTLYQFPGVVAAVGDGISRRLARDVPQARVVPFQRVLDWQFRTPQWGALPLGEVTEHLGVERVVKVDILEYRLNPPGNRFLWEGVCTARIGVIERDAIDPDMYVETFDVSASFPNKTGVGRDSAPAVAIEHGLLHEFIKKSAWLFHRHEEPKHPDKYRPQLANK